MKLNYSINDPENKTHNIVIAFLKYVSLWIAMRAKEQMIGPSDMINFAANFNNLVLQYLADIPKLTDEQLTEIAEDMSGSFKRQVGLIIQMRKMKEGI